MLSGFASISRSDLIQFRMLQSDKTTPIKSDYLLLCWLPLTDITPIFNTALVEVATATFSNGILEIGVMIKVWRACRLLTLPTPGLEIVLVEVTVATMDGYHSSWCFH